MANPIIVNGAKILMKNGSKIAAKVAPVVVKNSKAIIGVAGGLAFDAAKNAGEAIVENQKSLVKIPDLKEVMIDEAFKILAEKYNLTPIKIVAIPAPEFAGLKENTVVSQKPRSGARVSPNTAVKLYYITNDVIEKSKELKANKDVKKYIPKIINLDLIEARQILDSYRLNVTEKLEEPHVKFYKKVVGQVTRITYPNNKNIDKLLKNGDRVIVYYIDEEVLNRSKKLKEDQDEKNREKIKATKDSVNNIYVKVLDNNRKLTRKLSNNIKKNDEPKDQG